MKNIKISINIDNEGKHVILRSSDFNMIYLDMIFEEYQEIFSKHSISIQVDHFIPGNGWEEYQEKSLFYCSACNAIHENDITFDILYLEMIDSNVWRCPTCGRENGISFELYQELVC